MFWPSIKDLTLTDAKVIGALFTALVSLGRGQTFTMDWSFSYVASLLYLAVFGSMIAILLSVMFEDLKVTATRIIGVLMVLVGNLAILNRKPVGA